MKEVFITEEVVVKAGLSIPQIFDIIGQLSKQGFNFKGRSISAEKCPEKMAWRIFQEDENILQYYWRDLKNWWINLK